MLNTIFSFMMAVYYSRAAQFFAAVAIILNVGCAIWYKETMFYPQWAYIALAALSAFLVFDIQKGLNKRQKDDS